MPRCQDFASFCRKPERLLAPFSAYSKKKILLFNILMKPLKSGFDTVVSEKVILVYLLLTLPHCCACPKPGPAFPTSYVMVFLCLVSSVKMRGDFSFYGRDRVVVGFITTYAISVYPVEFNKSSTHVVSDMKIFKYQPLVIRKHLLIGLAAILNFQMQ
jgi:hypothetical protein